MESVIAESRTCSITHAVRSTACSSVTSSTVVGSQRVRDGDGDSQRFAEPVAAYLTASERASGLRQRHTVAGNLRKTAPPQKSDGGVERLHGRDRFQLRERFASCLVEIPKLFGHLFEVLVRQIEIVPVVLAHERARFPFVLPGRMRERRSSSREPLGN